MWVKSIGLWNFFIEKGQKHNFFGFVIFLRIHKGAISFQCHVLSSYSWTTQTVEGGARPRRPPLEPSSRKQCWQCWPPRSQAFFSTADTDTPDPPPTFIFVHCAAQRNRKFSLFSTIFSSGMYSILELNLVGCIGRAFTLCWLIRRPNNIEEKIQYFQ